MNFFYISPSTFPSRAANAVHVAMQCEALAQAGARVTLLARRAMPEAGALPGALRDSYGISLPGGRCVSFYTRTERAASLLIALRAFWEVHFGREKPDALLSRNLYASFWFGVIERRPLLFETHQLEPGWRKMLQRLIMTRPWVKTVVISKQLELCLAEHHGVAVANPVVLHDAAPEGAPPVPENARREKLFALYPEIAGPWRAVCGYFGHLYPGRGIEVIEAMAVARPESLFLVFGGHEADVARCRANNALLNLKFMGHVAHARAQEAMRLADVLLMPYQAKVGIGAKGQDTARWMSPMKMFEYMASGVPLISSDLPVLREVLRDGENALLVPPAEASAWIAALDRLANDDALAKRVARAAFNDYKDNHTWAQRAQRLIALARSL